MSLRHRCGSRWARVTLGALVLAAGCSGGQDAADGDASPDGADAGDVSDAFDAAEGVDDVLDGAPETVLDAGEVGLDSGTDVPADTGSDVPPPPMNFYFGNFHSHTSFSEGDGPPSANYAWARDVAGFDFYAVTDHAEQLLGDEWDDTGAQADAANEDGVFVALRGFEWSHPLIGHSCVFTTADHSSAVTDFLLGMYYDWLDASGGLAQFNHPGREWSNFNDLEFVSRVADNFFAIEVANKGDSISAGEYLTFYAQALDAGWYVAPTSNQDNHGQTTNCHRSVFVGPELSRDGLLDAMRARRIYATDDPNLQLTFRAGDHWMGSRVPAPVDPVDFTIRLVDDEPITRVELISNGGVLIFGETPAAGATEVTWEPRVWVAAGQWYYVKVTEADLLDGEPPAQTAVSAPIWFD